jgi:hypothetical protein
MVTNMAYSIGLNVPRATRSAAIAVALLLCLFPAGAAVAGPIVLENEKVRLEVDSDHGTITRIVDKQGQIRLDPIGGLADNFRLTLCAADKKNKTILGRKQKLASKSVADNRLELAWNGPLVDNEGGTHNLRARMRIQLDGPALEFRFFVQNDTAYKVADAWYPIVGGLARFGRGSATGDASVMLPTPSPTIKRLVAPFGEMALHYPAQMNMSYSSVCDAKSKRAMYFASHDPVARLKYYRFFEQSLPGGKDIFACIQHRPFTPTGKQFAGSPVVLRFYEGDWKAAGPIYREWFVKTFGVLDPLQQWIRRESFFQDMMCILPEGTLNMTFKEIPRWAKDAHDRGVRSLLISGWNRGGHDNGYPYYEPDPRLGTCDDLKRGLAECHKMGMRVYFFVNYQPAMVESDWYKDELHRYVTIGENGGRGEVGFGMGTLWARIGHPKIMVSIDPSFPEYRNALIKQFLRLVEVGADGLHVDKMGPGLMNFNPRCELGPDITTWEGPIRLTRQLLKEAHKINPDFAMSFECFWDRLLEFSGSVWWRGNMTFVRSVFPEMAETWSIYSPYDYLGVNDAVRLGETILLGPLNYSRSIGWEPWKGLANYVQEVKRIRDGLNDTVFLGEALGHEQIQLGNEPAYGVEYSVFRSKKTGRRVCILTNSGREDQSQTIRAFDGGSRSVRIRVPFASPRDATMPTDVIVPAERITFVEELPESHEREVSATHTEALNSIKPLPSNPIANGGFESGDFTGWTADPNWCVDQNSCGEYRGWSGKSFAWSGGKGEAATGRLKSKPFVLNNEGVCLLIAGWIIKPGSNRSWNYVTLKSADGTELDRRTPVNSLTFSPVLLDGSGHNGELVYVEAADDADQECYSMFCIDDVRTVALPPGQTRPLERLPAFDVKSSITLENDRYCLQVNRANGAITRIFDKAGQRELIREPRLAGNFKFTLPLPGRQPWETIEANYIVGKDQTLSSLDLKRDKLTLSWRNPRNSAGQQYDATVVMEIALEDDSIRFTMQIENRTPYQIGEVFFPILGGVTGLGDTYKQLKSTRLVRPAGDGFASSDMFFNFTNFSGLGDQGAEQFYRYPGSLSEPWMELSAGTGRHRGLYLGAHDAANRSLVLHLELQPGNAQTPRWDGNWPRREELGGLPAGVLFSFVEFANHPPGKTFNAAQIVLQAHEGEPQTGRQIYRKWKTSL